MHWSIYLSPFNLADIYWLKNNARRNGRIRLQKYSVRREKWNEQVSCICHSAQSSMCHLYLFGLPSFLSYSVLHFALSFFFPLPPNPHFLCCAFSVWFAYRIQIQLEKFFLESGLHSLHRHFLSVYPFDGQCCSVRHTSLALFFGSVFAFLFFCWVSFIFLFCCYKYFQCLRHEHNERELLDKNPSLNSKRTKIE